MNNVQEISGKIVCDEEIISGTIIFEDIIKDLKSAKDKNYTNYIIPGFIDLHCHGGNGYDSMEGLQSIKKISEYHLSHGTTTLYPTTVTAKLEDTLRALKGLNNYLNLNKEISNIDGIHLEGPFINPNKMGAQPPFAQLPSYSFIKTLIKEAPIKIMTLAPEIKGGLELIDFLIKNDIKPQIGHSLADYNCCILAIEKGVKSFTHLYNAMSGFQHRNPGVVAAAFSKAKYAEIICDLIHVNKEMIKIAFKNIDRLYSITDSISASGMPDGKYKVGTYEVYKKNGVVKLNEDTLGGSIVTMDKAFNNLIEVGFSIQEAVKMTSTNAARYLDRKDIGHISKEAKANLLVLDSKLNLVEIYLNGNIIS